jgi:putative peptide zinc metalloprotease protein
MAKIMTDSSDVSLPPSFRRRADLIAAPIWFGYQRLHVVTDPLNRQYFHLRDDEWFVLQQLDGMCTLEALCERYNHEYPGRQLSRPKLLDLIYRLHQFNLVDAAAEGQADRLIKQARRQRRHRRFTTWSNLLFLRLPGVDPDTWLRRLVPVFGRFFSPAGILLNGLFLFATFLWLLVHVDRFAERLPTLDYLMSFRGLLPIVLVMGATKACHELGHGLACKVYGAECREIGPMLMVFAPTLYCDTSDVWRLPHRWQRIMVGLAGVYVELVLAGVAAWIWWWTEPGWLHDISFAVMLVSSLSTVLINANPLLRYDGYYVLMDWWGIPNLSQRASEQMHRVFRWYFGQWPDRDDAQLARFSATLWLYGIAATIYRWALVAGILMLIASWLHRQNLPGLATLYTTTVMLGILIGPARRIQQLVKSPVTRGQIARLRTVFAIGLPVLLGCVIFTYPWPHRVACRGTIRSQDRQTVYVAVEGHLLRSAVRDGSWVESGETIAELDNASLRQELLVAQSQRDLQQQHVDELRLLQTQHAHLGAELPAAESLLADLQNRLQNKEAQLQRLILRAPSAGRVIGVSIANLREKRSSPGWQGQPLDQENFGAFLSAGTPVAHVAPPDRWEAVLIVDDSQRRFVKRGQTVMLIAMADTKMVVSGTVADISAELETEQDPPTISAQESVNETFDTHAKPRYAVRIPLEAAGHAWNDGNQVLARIHVGSESLASRLWRVFAQTRRLR